MLVGSEIPWKLVDYTYNKNSATYILTQRYLGGRRAPAKIKQQ